MFMVVFKGGDIGIFYIASTYQRHIRQWLFHHIISLSTSPDDVGMTIVDDFLILEIWFRRQQIIGIETDNNTPLNIQTR